MSNSSTKEIKISIPEELFALFIPEETIGHLKKAKIELRKRHGQKAREKKSRSPNQKYFDCLTAWSDNINYQPTK